MREIHVFDNGLKVFADHLTQAQKERYATTNLHEPEEEDLFTTAIEKLPKAGCFVSIGTAIGYYVVLAKKIRKDLEIHCFDPLPEHIGRLKENIELNGLNKSEFKIHQIAVSSKAGTASFLEDSFASSIEDTNWKNRIANAFRFIARGSPPKRKPCRSILVRAVTLGGVFELTARQKIELIQMDIQGHELPVLREFFRSQAKFAAMEFILGTHGPHIHPKCLQLFIENNYNIISDIPDCEGQPDGIIHCRLKG